MFDGLKAALTKVLADRPVNAVEALETSVLATPPPATLTVPLVPPAVSHAAPRRLAESQRTHPVSMACATCSRVNIVAWQSPPAMWHHCPPHRACSPLQLQPRPLQPLTCSGKPREKAHFVASACVADGLREVVQLCGVPYHGQARLP